ncbi:hypothetical protein MMC10_008665 [Thelotrema lepadinum]|nr:hypothetical protein [Thelotrema lepadinum]
MNTQNTDSSLRPRNRRLISVEDDLPSIDLGLSSAPLAASGISSTFASRASSPFSSLHPSRSSSTQRVPPPRSQTVNRSTKKWNLGLPTPSSGTFSLFSPKLWEDSWSSIQGVATTLLGTDIRDAPKSATLPRARKGLYYGGPATDEWGPTISVERSLAAGSREDRQAQIQAKKREALLTANGHARRDASGRYKRKTSIDRADDFAPVDPSGDALVYLHHVQPGDTSAGLSIKYSCPEAILRKANRLWPNDSIQLRNIAYLPVDACGVRGKKIAAPEPSTLDSLSDGKNEEYTMPTPTPLSDDWSIPTTPKAAQQPNHTSTSTAATSPAISTTTNSLDTSPPYTHDSWVQILSFPSPTEIARLPRQTLGFFPPARRKSIPYTDTSASTPPPSSPYTSPTLSPARRRDSTNLPYPTTTSTRPFSPIRPRPSSHHQAKSRTNSTATNPAHAHALFASHLHGPGGVGSLSSSSFGPGPAQDKLNQIFAPHLPDVAPRVSFESVGSGISTSTGTGTGLEQLGGKVEGWVRRMARRAGEGIDGRGMGIGGGGRGGGRGEEGSGGIGGRDLIELVEGWDMGGAGGGGGGYGREGRGREREGERGERPGGSGGDEGAGVNVGVGMERGRKGGGREEAVGLSRDRDDEEARLAERFPVRGRVFGEVKRGT